MPRNQDGYDLNTSRPYPVADNASLIDNNGNRLPSHIICGLHLLFPDTAGSYAYLGAVTVTEHLVSVIIMASGNTEASSIIPIASFSMGKPVLKYRQYSLTEVYPGAGGWIAFGEGIDEEYTGRFASAAQSLLAARVARRYAGFPIPNVGKAGNNSPLTGLVLLEGGRDVEIVSECREVPAYPVPSHNPYYCGSDELGTQVRDVIVIRLKSTEEDEENVLDKYRGPRDGRPESLSCGDPQPIQFLGPVSPDCCGNIYLEFRGCATVSRVTKEDEDDACGVLLDCSQGIDTACVTAKYLPDASGKLPSEYDDLCEASYSEVVEAAEEEVIWASDAFLGQITGTNLDARLTDGYGYPIAAEIGAGVEWEADTEYRVHATGYIYRTNTVATFDDYAILVEELPEYLFDMSCEFELPVLTNTVVVSLVASSQLVAAGTGHLRLEPQLILRPAGSSDMEYWGQSSAVASRKIGVSATGWAPLTNTRHRLTARITASAVTMILERSDGTTVATLTQAHPADILTELEQLKYAGFKLSLRNTYLYSYVVGESGTGPGNDQSDTPSGSLPLSQDFDTAGDWVLRRGDFDLDVNLICYADTFTRGNSTNLGSTELGNRAWVETLGDWQISGNKLALVSIAAQPSATAVVETDQADVTVTADVVWTTGGYHGVIARQSGSGTAQTFWLAAVSPTEFGLWQHVSGAWAKRQATPFSPTNGVAYTIALTCDDTNLSATIDGGSEINYSSSLNQTATRHGVRADLADPTFDNFSVCENFPSTTLFITQSAATLNLATYEPSTPTGTLGRQVETEFQMQAGPRGARHHAGIVINYKATATAGVYQFWAVDVDWDGQFENFKALRISHETGFGWVSDLAVAIPDLELDTTYKLKAIVYSGTGDSAWITGELLDASDVSIASIGPLRFNDYTPDEGLFGLLANRAVTKFESFTVDNYP